jgi:hypothetical protein
VIYLFVCCVSSLGPAVLGGRDRNGFIFISPAVSVGPQNSPQDCLLDEKVFKQILHEFKSIIKAV